MISKYPGRCAICAKPTQAGVDSYDPKSKQSYHQACRQGFMAEVERPETNGSDAESLAERLGYEK